MGDAGIVIPEGLLEYFLLVIKESLFGLILGYVTTIILIGIQIGGQIIDFQGGFSVASTFDPMAGTTVSLYGRFYYWFGIITFFTINGHHYLFYSLIQSFELIPLSGFYNFNFDASSVISLFSESFLIAFQIAVPIVITIFLSDIVIGLLARTVPQLNVFILGLPLKVLIGFLTTIILLSSISNEIVYIIESIPGKVERILTLFT